MTTAAQIQTGGPASRQGRVNRGKVSAHFHYERAVLGELQPARFAELGPAISAAMQEPGRAQRVGQPLCWRPERAGTDLVVTVLAQQGATEVTVTETVPHRLRRWPLSLKLVFCTPFLVWGGLWWATDRWWLSMIASLFVSTQVAFWRDALVKQAVEARVTALEAHATAVVELVHAAMLPAPAARPR